MHVLILIWPVASGQLTGWPLYTRHITRYTGGRVRKRGRVVECTGLENRQGGNPFVSSNLTASANTGDLQDGAFLNRGMSPLLIPKLLVIHRRRTQPSIRP